MDLVGFGPVGIWSSSSSLGSARFNGLSNKWADGTDQAWHLLDMYKHETKLASWRGETVKIVDQDKSCVAKVIEPVRVQGGSKGWAIPEGACTIAPLRSQVSKVESLSVVVRMSKAPVVVHRPDRGLLSGDLAKHHGAVGEFTDRLLLVPFLTTLRQQMELVFDFSLVHFQADPFREECKARMSRLY